MRIGIGAGQVLRRELWLWNAGAHPAADARLRVAQGGALARAAARAARGGGRRALRAAHGGRPGAGRARRRRSRCWPSRARGRALRGRRREALLFRRAERRARARRRRGASRAQSSGLDADGALLMARRPAVRVPRGRVRGRRGDRGRVRSARRSSCARHVAIPGTLALLPAESVRFTSGNIVDRGRGPGVRALVLRPLPRPRAFPRAARAAAPAGALRRAR